MRHINLASFNTIQRNVTTSGTPVRLSGYRAATTIAFNNNGDSADTVTDSANLFLKSGFRPGDLLVITGSASNNNTYEIATVVAGTITLVKNSVLTTEAAGASVVLDTSRGIDVPDGVTVVVKAKAANVGTITIGPTSARALNTNTDFYSNSRIAAGQSVDLDIKNLKSIWIDATTSNEGVEVIFEN